MEDNFENDYNINPNVEIKAKEIGEIRENCIYNFLERIMNIIFCSCISLVAIPIIFVTCIFVVLETRGSPIYKQERLGKNGKPFFIYKIRSMCNDAEIECGAKWADKNDSRITKTGKFIRKTRIDELPQLFNIIKGDMNIVGPRPERALFYYKFEKEDAPGFSRRLLVKPGLTGIAQISGGYDITPAEKLELDMKYIYNRSLWMEIKIILKTIFIVLSGKGAR